MNQVQSGRQAKAEWEWNRRQTLMRYSINIRRCSLSRRGWFRFMELWVVLSALHQTHWTKSTQHLTFDAAAPPSRVESDNVRQEACISKFFGSDRRSCCPMVLLRRCFRQKSEIWHIHLEKLIPKVFFSTGLSAVNSVSSSYSSDKCLTWIPGPGNKKQKTEKNKQLQQWAFIRTGLHCDWNEEQRFIIINELI